MSALTIEVEPADARPFLTRPCDGTAKTKDGRTRHYFTKVDGQWRCACGATR